MSNESSLGERVRGRLASRYQQKDETFSQWLRRRTSAGTSETTLEARKPSGKEGEQS